jgi:hypothetical protein
VQNTDDHGVRRQNSRRYHHDYSKKENKSTEQTTQSATRFPMNELPQPQFPDSPAGFPPAARLLNLPALTLAAVSK